MTMIVAPLTDDVPFAGAQGPAPVATTVAPGASVAGQAARYLAASVAALALDSALLWVAVERLAMPVWFGGALGYSVGLVLVYLLSVRWVFAERVVGDARREFLLFAALGVVGLVVNSSTLTVATACGLALPWAKGVAAAVGFTTNFASRKLVLFTARSA